MASDFPGMTKTQFRLGVIAIFAAILLHNLTNPNRHTFIKNSAPYDKHRLVDGLTGKVYSWNGDEWMELK